MGLFDFLKKKKRQRPTQQVPHKHAPVNRKSDQMDRLTKDGEPPDGWYYKNSGYTSPIRETCRVLYQQVYDTQHDSPMRHMAALKEYTAFLRSVEKECQQKGECFVFWYNEILTTYGNPEFEEKYKYYCENIEKLEKEYVRKKQIQKEILKIIKENPNILQTDVYKRFAPEEKIIVSNELYRYAGNGEIERTKSGRTYSLRIK